MITALVINWNGQGHLRRCFDALLAQDPPLDEVILVDNHSDDGSRAWAAATYGDSVRIVDTGANLGPAGARNVGLAAASHETCLLIDNDVELLPGTVAGMRKVLEADPSAAAVQARSVCGDDPRLVHYDHSDLHPLGLLVLHNWFAPLSTAAQPIGPIGAFVALCVLVRKPAFTAVGGFFEPLFILFEDNEVSYRLRAAGHTIRLATETPCIHHGGTAGLSVRGEGAPYPPRRTFLHARNRWLFLMASVRPRTFWMNLPIHLMYDLVHLGFSAMRGPAHIGAWLRGHGAAFARRRAARARRRALDPLRVVADRDLFAGTAGLTPNPGLASRGVRALLRRAIDGVVKLHWRVVHRWLG